MTREATLQRIRLLLGAFIVGLILSGITAFPLLAEMDLLARMLGLDASAEPSAYAGLHFWIATVWQGLRDTYARYPFIAYGTDWLAFGHIVIAFFFVPVLVDPVRYRGNLLCGLWACALVLPIALVCGPIRGIPFYWRLIDCSFGILGAIPLVYVLRLTDRLGKFSGTPSVGARKPLPT